MSTITLPQTPARSLVQREAALERANEVRKRRAGLKRDLKAGQEGWQRPGVAPVSLARVVAVLSDPPEWAGSMRVLDLLLAVPKVGRVKANRALCQARVSPSKTLGGLSPRQRSELVALMGGGR